MARGGGCRDRGREVPHRAVCRDRLGRWLRGVPCSLQAVARGVPCSLQAVACACVLEVCRARGDWRCVVLEVCPCSGCVVLEACRARGVSCSFGRWPRCAVLAAGDGSSVAGHTCQVVHCQQEHTMDNTHHCTVAASQPARRLTPNPPETCRQCQECPQALQTAGRRRSRHTDGRPPPADHPHA